MRLFIQANDKQKLELGELICGRSEISISDLLPTQEKSKDYDAFFILNQNPESIDFDLFKDKPVFINEVVLTLSTLKTAKNICRLNAWPTFLGREVWEIAGNNESNSEIFELLGKKMVHVKDSPGMVSARVIAMIINEAYYALKENVSTKEEIDLAMKLGTNYPFGPFEWSEMIGIIRIHSLLSELSKTDDRCIPAFKPGENLSND